jgi:hypothetical protein
MKKPLEKILEAFLLTIEKLLSNLGQLIFHIMKTEASIHAVEIFSAGIEEAEFVKSLLEDAEIDVYIKDEFMGTLFPWVAAPGGAGSVCLVVSSENEDKALSIINAYNKQK